MDTHSMHRSARGLTALMLIIVAGVSGCSAQHIKQNQLRLTESALTIRAMQTRTFAASSEAQILSATAAALQDMEYNIDQIESPLGIITATKVSDADSTSEIFGRLVLDLLCGCGMSYNAADKHAITITTVVLPNLATRGEYVTRITIQQATYNKQSQIISRGAIEDPEAYQAIFEKLSKALFIEVNGHV